MEKFCEPRYLAMPQEPTCVPCGTRTHAHDLKDGRTQTEEIRVIGTKIYSMKQVVNLPASFIVAVLTCYDDGSRSV